MLGSCAFPVLHVFVDEGMARGSELMDDAINRSSGGSLLVLTCRQFEVSAAAASPQQSAGDGPCLARQPAQPVQT